MSVPRGANGPRCSVWGPGAEADARVPGGPDRDGRRPERAQARRSARRWNVAGRWEVEVLLRRVQPEQPPGQHAATTRACPSSDRNVSLTLAPTNPKEFTSLAVRMAEILRPTSCILPPRDRRVRARRRRPPGSPPPPTTRAGQRPPARERPTLPGTSRVPSGRFTNGRPEEEPPGEPQPTPGAVPPAAPVRRHRVGTNPDMHTTSAHECPPRRTADPNPIPS